MWTPRRILLLILGLAASLAAYFVYSLVLGGVDGLPELPQAFLLSDDDKEIRPIVDVVSPTILRLQEAFGPNSPEVTDPIAYKTKLELRDRGLVFACGQPAFSAEPSKFVTVAPFSLALFGKSRPQHLRDPGEISEISTFHADKAILEFDRPVTSPQDLNGKAALVGIELVSTPDVPSPDSRKGRIWVTNNQRSPDAGQHLIFRTPGPLFYRAPEATNGKPAADAPQIWTASAVEVLDRRNLPRPLRSPVPSAVPSRADDLRARNAVANILLGSTLPPPTITAEGMKIYLDQQDDKAPAGKRNSTGYSGVRLVELVEKVQMNLWSTGGGGFPGSESEAPVKAPAVDPPEELAAVVGGAADAAAISRLLASKTLLVIETLGSFRYDFEKSIARFETAPVANPALPNHVTASRLSARGAQDNLFCKVLVVEFGNPPATTPQPNTGRPAAQTSEPTGGRKIQSLTATGDHVFISVEAEQLLAQGTELHYAAPVGGRSVTTLRGSPVVAVRDRNRMQGGDAKTAANVIITSIEPPPGTPGKKSSAVEVRGPGRIELFDQASNDNTLQATWGTSLTQERQLVGGKEQDLLKFEGGGSFADVKGGMRLSADRLWLWLSGADSQAGLPAPPKSGAPAALPQRLVAVGRVDGTSPELMIRRTDQLTVWFRDLPQTTPEPGRGSVALVPPPGEPGGASLPTPKPVNPNPDVPPPPTDLAKKPEEKPKQPIWISARVVESWVIRTPQLAVAAVPPAPAPKPANQPVLHYELERARCEDRVMVHQPPADPKKSPRGVDIFGSKLNLDQSQAGSVLTVHGAGQNWAQVYFEDMSLFGPSVVIDQPHNAVSVDGRGMLRMPSAAESIGGQAGRSTEMEVQWATEMRFFGAKATAEFLGQVHAVQQPRAEELPRIPAPGVAPNPNVRAAGFLAVAQPNDPIGQPPKPDLSGTKSVLLCHRLDVTFDRPIYFNQLRKEPTPVSGAPKDPNKPEGKPKLRTALCTPMPDDELAKAPGLPIRTVSFTEEVTSAAGKIARAQRVTARQIDVKNDDREQLMYATGPGEVRILQLGSKDATTQPPAEGAPPPKAEDQEMKLTVVRFPSRLVARDTGKVFQEATFDDGARVVQIPTDDINAQVVEHALPPRGVFLACTEMMKVSTNRAKKDAPPEQWMTAVGNSEFKTDEYEGVSSKIVYDGKVTIFEGSNGRLAKLYRKRRGVNDQDYHTGEKIIYNNRDGTVTGSGSVGGSISQ